MGVYSAYIKDAHGSVSGKINADGELLTEYKYDSFGNLYTDDTPDSFGYCGEYLDNESGLIYLRNRYYDTADGRFITEDPMKDGLNWYVYCSNEPVMRSDPSGLESEFEGYTARELLEQINAERENYANAKEAAPNNVLELDKIHCRADFLRSAVIATIEYNGGNDEHMAFKATVDSAFSNPNGQTDSQMSKLIQIASGFTDSKAKKIDVSATNAARGITKTFVTKTPTETICFVKGTLISTKNGYKEIQYIQIGDMVYSKNEYTGEENYKRVVNTFVNETDILVHIQTDNDTIISTEKHPFWVKGKGWTSANDIQYGDILIGKNNENIKVLSCITEYLQKPVKVYNFEVEDWHTYFVGNGIWVHNTCNFFAGPITEKGALEAAEQWLGVGYFEYAPGIYRSADNSREFRMASRDLDGHGGMMPHVHFITYATSKKPTENSHVYIIDERKKNEN